MSSSSSSWLRPPASARPRAGVSWGVPALVLLLLLLALPAVDPGGLAGASAARAQEPAEPASVEEPQEAPPALGQLLQENVERDALDALEEVEALAAAGELAERLVVAEAAVEQLEAVERSVASAPLLDRETIAATVARADFQGRRLAELDAALASRLTALEEVRQSWEERKERWLAVREEIVDRPDLWRAYRETFGDASRRIDEVLGLLTAAPADLLGLQARVRALDERTETIAREARLSLEGWRAALLSANRPPMVSSAFWSGLASTTAPPPPPRWENVLGYHPEARRWNLGVILAQIALLLGVAWLARRFRPRADSEGFLHRILGRPWSIGLLVAITALSMFHAPLSPLGELIQELLAALAALRLVPAFFRSPRKRRVARLTAVWAVLLDGVAVLGLATPLVRLLVLAVALSGLVPLAWTLVGHRRGRASGADPGEPILGRVAALGAVAFAAVVVAEVVGFHLLAYWFLDAAVDTAFIGLLWVFLVRIGRGALRLALGGDTLVARVVRPVGERLLGLYKVLLVALAVPWVADAWGLTGGVRGFWEPVLARGFDLGAHRFTVGQMVLAALVVYAALLAAPLLRSLLHERVFADTGLDRGSRDSISTLLGYVVALGAFLLALSTLGFDLSQVVLLLSALGIGVGLGLQDLVHNFSSGLVLLFERPIRVGDVIDYEGQWATVQKIGLRSTIVQTYDRADVVVPNSELVSKRVINWTLSNRVLRLSLEVGVAYGTDPERVLRVLRSAADGFDQLLDDPEPMVVLVGFGDSSVDFELRVWLADIDDLIATRTELATAVVARFAEAGIPIPFPQRDLHLRTVPEGWPSDGAIPSGRSPADHPPERPDEAPGAGESPARREDERPDGA